MANSQQAKKRIRQNEKRRLHNAGKRAMMRTAIKKVISAIKQKSKDLASQELQKASSILDKLVNKGIIHKNKAARHKSRLTKQVKAL